MLWRRKSIALELIGKIWGVCGGLAKYFNKDPTVIRVIAALSLLFGTLGLWAYIVMALVVPLEGSQVIRPKGEIKGDVQCAQNDKEVKDDEDRQET